MLPEMLYHLIIWISLGTESISWWHPFLHFDLHSLDHVLTKQYGGCKRSGLQHTCEGSRETLHPWSCCLCSSGCWLCSLQTRALLLQAPCKSRKSPFLPNTGCVWLKIRMQSPCTLAHVLRRGSRRGDALAESVLVIAAQHRAVAVSSNRRRSLSLCNASL